MRPRWPPSSGRRDVHKHPVATLISKTGVPYGHVARDREAPEAAGVETRHRTTPLGMIGTRNYTDYKPKDRVLILSAVELSFDPGGGAAAVRPPGASYWTRQVSQRSGLTSPSPSGRFQA